MAEDRSVPKSDRERVQTILDEIGRAGNRAKQEKRRVDTFRINDPASKLLINYVEEAVTAILQESSQLAKHRNSSVVEVEDLQLILIKKYGIEVPGFVRSQLLHKQSITSNIHASSSKSILIKDSDGSSSSSTKGMKRGSDESASQTSAATKKRKR